VERRELWRQRIAQQGKSGQSIRMFCGEQNLSEPSFYAWRKRLRNETKPVRFALVEPKAVADTGAPIEVMLASGDRLCIPGDAATLRLVLAVLREQV
jgi:hypothetical protein